MTLATSDCCGLWVWVSDGEAGDAGVRTGFGFESLLVEDDDVDGFEDCGGAGLFIGELSLSR